MKIALSVSSYSKTNMSFNDYIFHMSPPCQFVYKNVDDILCKFQIKLILKPLFVMYENFYTLKQLLYQDHMMALTAQ